MKNKETDKFELDGVSLATFCFVIGAILLFELSPEYVLYPLKNISNLLFGLCSAALTCFVIFIFSVVASDKKRWQKYKVLQAILFCIIAVVIVWFAKYSWFTSDEQKIQAQQINGESIANENSYDYMFGYDAGAKDEREAILDNPEYFGLYTEVTIRENPEYFGLYNEDTAIEYAEEQLSEYN